MWNIVQNSSFWFNHNLVNFECFWVTQITISLDLEVTLVIKSLKTLHHYIWYVQIFHSSLAINWIYLLMWYKVVSGDWVVWFCFRFYGEKNHIVAQNINIYNVRLYLYFYSYFTEIESFFSKGFLEIIY